jgi:predicted acetyltransferase
MLYMRIPLLSDKANCDFYLFIFGVENYPIDVSIVSPNDSHFPASQPAAQY